MLVATGGTVKLRLAVINYAALVAGKKIVPKAPKFNIMWLYAVIILGLFVVQYMFSENNAKIINYQKFENEMLKPGDVEKLVAYKNGDLYNVDVYIKKDRLELPLNDKRNALRIKMVNEAFGRNEFSFYFYRTFNANPLQYSPVEYELRNYKR